MGYFHNTPIETEGTLVAGWITPVLHYTMGGITMDETCAVLRADGSRIPNLHAAGEVTGGVHGNNRLGGNSLLECTVFGTIVGKHIPIRKTNEMKNSGTKRNEIKSSK